MSVARTERRQLADLFDEVGPDAPTLCTPWHTRDLAVHLLVRERRPDAVSGYFVNAFAGYTHLVERRYQRWPWPKLVDTIRNGPPRWSVFGLEAADRAGNAAEFFVHHEDVRRAQEGWRPRPADPDRDGELWSVLTRFARVLLRKVPVGVVLRRPDGAEITGRRGPDTVTLVGQPGELLLYAYGREAAEVDFEGDQVSIARVRAARRGI
ncbi:TIGR03085 family protein [Longimycelium tulufanense]|uniref:TIGR03085 family protein n=1 Tax=Longimycelium tulufanense TaxID=907463 RepID=A0A8J3C678_9PSEU|nr:TIGR03085 family metal-binding protein [Longimycelium tulufanense]GGM38149.1 TIGR03085 family protein [Longimycelium tulufanense]